MIDFLKRHWATVILIVLVATWLGISMGTNRCPSCVLSGILKETFSDEVQLTKTSPSNSPAHVKWEAKDVHGNVIGNLDTDGKVSVIAFWATYCKSCKNEVADLVAVRNKFSEEDVEIIAFSVDEAHKDLDQYAKEHGINFKVVRADEHLKQAWGPIDYLPTILILNRQGGMSFRYSGYLDEEVLAERVSAALADGGDELVRQF